MTADDAVELVAEQAILASQQDTFAVGGALIDNASGTVVMAMHNNVLVPPDGDKDGFLLHDPTAHGERQLVDWYFDNADELGLAPPAEMTVITTLDPCAMCAGALMTAGFNVGVSAIDDYAGINYDSSFTFPSFPPAVRPQAQQRFGYYAVAAPCARKGSGGASTAFGDETIGAVTYLLTLLVFSSGVDAIRTASNTPTIDPSKLQDPAQLPAGSPVRTALTALYADTLTVKSTSWRFPGAELAEPLLTTAKAAHAAGGHFNAVALLDPFGNLLTCTGGQEGQSPIRTAFLLATRTYAEMRWTLMNDPAMRDEATQHLTHVKYCTFVHLVAPDPATAQAVMTFGAYGSSIEGPAPQPFPSSFQYVTLPGAATEEDVAQLAAALPPLYTQSIGVAPMKVLDPALEAAVRPQMPSPPSP